MRAGQGHLAKKSWLVSTFFGDDEEIMAQIYRLNGLVMSGDMARITMEEIARAAEETGSAAAGTATDVMRTLRRRFTTSRALVKSCSSEVSSGMSRLAVQAGERKAWERSIARMR